MVAAPQTRSTKAKAPPRHAKFKVQVVTNTSLWRHDLQSINALESIPLIETTSG